MRQPPTLTIEQKAITLTVTSPEHDAVFTVTIDHGDDVKHTAEQFKKLADYLRLASSGKDCHKDSKLTVEVG